MGTKVKGEVVQSRRTALRSVSARAKKRFPVRVERRQVTVDLQFFVPFQVKAKVERTNPISFVSVTHLAVLH